MAPPRAGTADTAPAAETAPAARRRKPTGPAPTLVLFVRHGTTPTTGQVLPGRAAGLHLADRGREQAERVAERLAGWRAAPATAAEPARSAAKRAATPARRSVTAVYASPLERTRETAAPIARALGLKVQAQRGLLECDFGDWTGRQLKELARLPEWQTVQRFPSGFRFPGGESFAGMQARMVDTVTALVARHPGETIVAVSHADPIKAAVAEAMGTHLDLFQRIVISPCSVTAVSYGAAGPVVLGVNSTASLDELVPS
ncbi:MAG TPA: histidine phosphatase family protein [Acidimicrobiales bacterium]|nr:histidine phosphatase family protein [Acidimicrobiales bacterium]